MEGKGAAASALVLAPSRASGGGGLSKQQKIMLVVAAAGVTTVYLFARHFRRPTRSRKSSNPSNNSASSSTTRLITGLDVADGFNRLSTTGFSPRPGHNQGQSHQGRSSVTSSILTQSTLVSNSVIEPGSPGLTCTQLGILGMETLEKSISFWDESLHLLRQEKELLGADGGDDEVQQCNVTINQLQEILQAARHLQHLAEDLYLDEGSVLYAESEHASYHYEYGHHSRLRSASSVESFQSAEDFLSDDEEIRQSLESAGFLPGAGGDGVWPLYEAAMRLVEVNTVPYRSLKTEMVGCKLGDHEYLAKLHCLRGAFSRIISNVEKRHWICVKGKEVFSQMLYKADKDPSDFIVSYDAMISWSQDSGNWGLIENELKDRGLRALTFYDIVLDYIFLDAFEDLESPPASVLAVTQNRWLSNSFKETALSTAVWSVLKTKRKWLRYPNGFMAHFYTLSEHIMPTLAWGFLGPSNTIQEFCFFFKDKFLEFLNTIFSFEGVRYTTLDELAEDVMKRLEVMHSQIIKQLTEIPSPY